MLRRHFLKERFLRVKGQGKAAQSVCLSAAGNESPPRPSDVPRLEVRKQRRDCSQQLVRYVQVFLIHVYFPKHTQVWHAEESSRA